MNIFNTSEKFISFFEDTEYQPNNSAFLKNVSERAIITLKGIYYCENEFTNFWKPHPKAIVCLKLRLYCHQTNNYYT